MEEKFLDTLLQAPMSKMVYKQTILTSARRSMAPAAVQAVTNPLGQ
jgi:hypothetical protein